MAGMSPGGGGQSPLAAILMQALPMLLQRAQGGGGTGMGGGAPSPMGGAVPPAMNAGQPQQPMGGPQMGGGGMGGGGQQNPLMALLSHPQGLQMLMQILGQQGAGGARKQTQPAQRQGVPPAGNGLPGTGMNPQGTPNAAPAMGGPSNMLPGMMAQPGGMDGGGGGGMGGMMPSLGPPPAPPGMQPGAPSAGGLAPPSGINPALNQILQQLMGGGGGGMPSNAGQRMM